MRVPIKKEEDGPASLKTLYNIAGSLEAKEQAVDEVINHFRDTDTSFIMPPLNTALYPEIIMDISHESLMRQWSRLKDWVAEEAENGIMLTRLSEYQKLHQQDLKDFLEGKELVQMSDWYHSFNPQPAWAERYSLNYRESIQYLKESIRKRDEKDKEALRRKRIRRASILLSSIFVFILILALLINMSKEAQKALEENHVALEKVKINLDNLLKNRQNAIENENKLQALFFTTAALVLETDQRSIDSILENSKNKLHLLPAYSLRNYFLCSSAVNRALPGTAYKTIYIWTEDSLLSEMNAETGAVIRSAKYEPGLGRESKKSVMQTRTKIFSNIASTTFNMKDTVIEDSSLYFVHTFANIQDKDDAGFPVYSQHIRHIYGASFSSDGKQILTWGQNSNQITVLLIYGPMKDCHPVFL